MAYTITITCDACGHAEHIPDWGEAETVGSAITHLIDRDEWQRITYTLHRDVKSEYGNGIVRRRIDVDELRCPACAISPAAHQAERIAV